jgi:acyl carrier protein
MPDARTIQLICTTIRTTLADKGESVGELDSSSVLLNGNLHLDSLDLAAIVVELEHATGRSPFSNGFVEFQTVQELAELFDNAPNA